MDQYSCVLVKRNPMWFKAAIPTIERVWGIILNERATGYEHRAPKKRSPPKKKTTNDDNNIVSSSSGCLIVISDIDFNL